MGTLKKLGFLMNELYEQTITVHGKTYRYDPDFDLYYRCEPQPPETVKERWIKIIAAVTLLVIIVLGTPPLLEWLK